MSSKGFAARAQSAGDRAANSQASTGGGSINTAGSEKGSSTSESEPAQVDRGIKCKKG